MKPILKFLLLVAGWLLTGALSAQTPPPRRDTAHRYDSMPRKTHRRDTTRYRQRQPQNGDTMYRRVKRMGDTAGKRIPPRTEK